MRRSIGNLLESAGHTIAMYSSAEEFVNAGPPAETDCLVLDIRMPGMDGLELQHLMKDVRPRLPVIFVTAHADERTRSRAMTQGAYHFFRKPFDGTELLETVEECVKRGIQMSPNNPIKVLTVDDHHIIREGIANVIDNQ